MWFTMEKLPPVLKECQACPELVEGRQISGFMPIIRETDSPRVFVLIQSCGKASVDLTSRGRGKKRGFVIHILVLFGTLQLPESQILVTVVNCNGTENGVI